MNPFSGKAAPFLTLSFLIRACLLMTACGPGSRNGYRTESGNVVLYKGFPASRSVIGAADPESFHAINDNYGRDKSKVFYLGYTIPSADPATFEYLGGSYSRDKTHGYSRDQLISNDGVNFGIVPNPDETDTQITAQGIAYAHDSKHVYKDVVIIEGADPASFKYMPMFNGYYLTLDRSRVYFNDQPMENVDGATFRKVSDFHFSSKTGAWGLVLGRDITWNPIANVDLASFAAVGKYYSKDKNHVYYSDYEVKNADPETFRETEYLQAKDKYRSYSSGYSAANKN